MKKIRNVRQRRMDGWTNQLTGVGDLARDKTLFAQYQAPTRINYQYAEALWLGSDMAARVVETLPDEMTREGWTLNVKDDAAPTPDDMGSEPPDINSDPADTDAVDEPAPANEEAKAAEDPKKKQPNFTGDAADFPAASDTPDKKPAVGTIKPTLPFGTKPKPGQLPTRLQAKPQVSQESKQLSEAVCARAEELKIDDVLNTALKFERAYGGCGIFLSVDDGTTDLSKPLNWDNVRKINALLPMSPRELYAIEYYGDPRYATYGKPSMYQMVREIITTEKSEIQNMLRIHESRVIRFEGIVTSRVQVYANQGWGDSLFVRVERVLSQFDQSWGGAAILLADFAQAVVKIKGLADMVASEGKDDLKARAEVMDMGRSLTRAVWLDADGEDFERKATSLTGYPDMLDRFCNRLAAAVHTPVTLLMGQAPAGLNATGQVDMDWFFNHVRSQQKTKLMPALELIIRLIFLELGEEPENWSIEFNPLKQLNDIEKATMRKTQADADVAYINAGVLTPEIVQRERFSGDKWSGETHVTADDMNTLSQVNAEADAQELDLKQQQIEAMANGQKPGKPGQGKPNAPPSKAPPA